MEMDFIIFAGVAILILHAFNSLIPYSKPSEFDKEEERRDKMVSTV